MLRAFEGRTSAAAGRALAARELSDEQSGAVQVGGEGEQGGNCTACGQPVSSAHLCERADELSRAAAAAEAAAAAAERDARRLQAALDGESLSTLDTKLGDLQAEASRAAHALKEAQAARAVRGSALEASRSAAAAAAQEAAAAGEAAAAELAGLEHTERSLSARARALSAALEEERRRAALQRLEVQHGEAKLAALEAEVNPHAIRLADAESQREALASRRAALDESLAAGAARRKLLIELQVRRDRGLLMISARFTDDGGHFCCRSTLGSAGCRR